MLTILEVKNLVKHFPIKGSKNVVCAVNGVSFKINEGQSLGLVGESGSGKTTVARCILKLVELSNGQIFFRGQEISHLSQREFRSFRANMQMVFQEPFDSLDPRMSIGALISEPLNAKGHLNRRGGENRLRELLQEVGLEEDNLARYPHELSGGQMQRVAIARAIATSPLFLILDEPVSSLDPSARGEILSLLRTLQKRLGLSYLYISHDLATVRQVCSHVAVMYLGKIVEISPVEGVFDSPRHPYSVALLSSFLNPDPRRKRARVVLKGEIPSPINLPQGCYLYNRCAFTRPECEKLAPPTVYIGEDHFVTCFAVVKETRSN